MIHVLEREQLVRRPVGEVFAFFADAANLERITPPRLSFKIVSPLPIEMRAGALIDYELRLFAVPFRWRTLIETFEPLVRFSDTQLRGPYRSWRHLHEFEAVPGGTRMCDRVEYEIPLGPLGELARTVFVTRQVESIFDYRRQAIEQLFPARAVTRPRAASETT
jgi:ligand-binding SRPBCC domain-containing protein